MLYRRTLLVALLAVPGAALAASCCGQITAEGARLASFLDGSGVERLWLPGFKVNWQTGVAVSVWEDDRPHTHCSAFAASAAEKLGIYVLRPPQHSAMLLANAQMGWLRSPEATTKGWEPMADVAAAQTQANQGRLVLAAYENPDASRPGHIAIVRPGDIGMAALMKHGPLVTQAGGHNAISVPLSHGFANHKGAWIAGGGGAVRFFAHSVDWSSLKT